MLWRPAHHSLDAQPTRHTPPDKGHRPRPEENSELVIYAVRLLACMMEMVFLIPVKDDLRIGRLVSRPMEIY
jgi:hypothetical protein